VATYNINFITNIQDLRDAFIQIIYGLISRRGQQQNAYKVEWKIKGE